MKKLLIATICVFMMFTTVSFATFSDVAEDHWAYEAISKMERLSILSGYPDGSFKPSNDVTLGEFASIFTKVFNITPNTEDNYFLDVKAEHWAKASVEAIREYIDPTYDPVAEKLDIDSFAYMPGIGADIKMPREAVIFALYRIFGYDEELYVEGEEQTLFADYDEILDPKSITIAYKSGIISGEVVNGKTYIRPQRYVKRAELSAMINNLLGYNDKFENKEGYTVLGNKVATFAENLSNCNFDEIKDLIYDPNSSLKAEAFNMNEYVTDDMKSIMKSLMKDFEYEVKSHGFTSFNHAYIEVEVKVPDIDSYISEAYMNFYENLNPEEFNQKLNEEIIPAIKKDIKAKKIKNTTKNLTINFVKYDDDWKIEL